MKIQTASERDRLSGSLEFTAAAEIQYIRLFGFNRNGTLTVTWSGAAGDLALDVSCSRMDSEIAGPFFSLLAAPMTDSGTIVIRDLCAGWLELDATGTVWGLIPDTLYIDYNIEIVGP